MKIRAVAVTALLMLTVGAAPAMASYPPNFQPASGINQIARDNGFRIYTSAATVKKLGCVTYTVNTSTSKPIQPYTLHIRSVLDKVNHCFILKVNGLPKNADAVLKNDIAERHIVLGTMRASSAGGLAFPAISYSKAGLYHLGVALNDKTWYVHVLIS